MTQEQISNTESAYLDSVARLRTLEGRYNLLRDRVLVVNNNLIEQYKKTVTEVKSVNDDIKEIKSDLFKIKEAMRHLLSELELFAKKDDVKYLEKYINLWDPMKLVTRKELEQAIEEIKKKKRVNDGRSES